MKKLEYISVGFFLVNAFVLQFISRNIFSISGTGTFISFFISFFIGIIIIAFYNYINKNSPYNNVGDLIKNVFGNFIYILFKLVILLICMCLFFNLINFINVNIMFDTPLIVTSIFLAVPIILIAKGNIFKNSLVWFYICLIFFIFIIFGTLFNFNLENFLPIINKGYIKGSLLIIIYNICPLFLLIYFKNKYSLYLPYFISILSVGLLLILIIGTCNIEILNILEYPLNYFLKSAGIGNLFSHFENILSIIWLISICISISYMFKIVTKDNKKTNLLGLVLIASALFLFSNLTIANSFYLYILPIIIFLFFIILPLILFIKIRYIKR